MDTKILAQLSYNPTTGLITKNGREVGWLDSTGYRRISVGKGQYLAHRVAWRLMTGNMPSTIDHINRDKEDNRWHNLREATMSENSFNVNLRRTNKSGLRGVYWMKRNSKWAASFNGYLGLFGTKLDAAAARISAENRSGLIT